MDTPNATYVWQAPVRLWHWVTTLCMIVLAVSGWLIGSPPRSVGGEAIDSFVFGYIRFAHFAAAYVFAVMMLMRIYWAFVGNRASREIFTVPRDLLRRDFLAGLFDQIVVYLRFAQSEREYEGHNPLAAVGMFAIYVLGALFMIVTGFALYGEGTGAGTWQHVLFTSWVVPLFGQSQDIHTWHHLGMWYLIIFVIVHLYFVLRDETGGHRTIVGAMINGYRATKP